MAEDKEKKEKVLHTRVSESLEDELKQRASDLGVSVSNLVRNVLQNAFEMVEDIVSDSTRVAKAAKGGISSNGVGAIADVSPVGWQEVLLNLNAVCNECNSILARGTKGGVAIYQSGKGPSVFLCTACLSELGATLTKETDNDSTAD